MPEKVGGGEGSTYICGGGVGPRPLYASPIHRVIVGGDLGEMKALALEAKQYLEQHGDVAAALDTLQLEIAKMEAK